MCAFQFATVAERHEENLLLEPRVFRISAGEDVGVEIEEFVLVEGIDQDWRHHGDRVGLAVRPDWDKKRMQEMEGRAGWQAAGGGE